MLQTSMLFGPPPPHHCDAMLLYSRIFNLKRPASCSDFIWCKIVFKHCFTAINIIIFFSPTWGERRLYYTGLNKPVYGQRHAQVVAMTAPRVYGRSIQTFHEIAYHARQLWHEIPLDLSYLLVGSDYFRTQPFCWKQIEQIDKIWRQGDWKR